MEHLAIKDDTSGLYVRRGKNKEAVPSGRA